MAIFEIGRRAQGTLPLAESEPVFQGHFPAEPVFPGVLTTEALAQTCGVLIAQAARAAGPPEAVRAAARRWYLARTDIKDEEMLQLAVQGVGR